MRSIRQKLLIYAIRNVNSGSSYATPILMFLFISLTHPTISLASWHLKVKVYTDPITVILNSKGVELLTVH